MKTFHINRSLYIGTQFPSSEVEITMEMTVECNPDPEIAAVRVLDNRKEVAFPDEIIDQITSDSSFERWLRAEIEALSQEAAENRADHMRDMRREDAHG